MFMFAWKVGSEVYQSNRASQLASRLNRLINSMNWKVGTKPYVEVGGPVSGKKGVAIRNIGAMNSCTFKAFSRAVERVFLEVMVD